MFYIYTRNLSLCFLSLLHTKLVAALEFTPDTNPLLLYFVIFFFFTSLAIIAGGGLRFVVLSQDVLFLVLFSALSALQ